MKVLLILLLGEPGSETVARLLERAGPSDRPVHMTELNYAEVQYVIRRKEGLAAWEAIARELPSTPIEFHPADRSLAGLAADFKARFKLSLADAFAAALAKRHRAELVTGDPEFKAVEGEVKAAWLSKR